MSMEIQTFISCEFSVSMDRFSCKQCMIRSFQIAWSTTGGSNQQLKKTIGQIRTEIGSLVGIESHWTPLSWQKKNPKKMPRSFTSTPTCMLEVFWKKNNFSYCPPWNYNSHFYPLTKGRNCTPPPPQKDISSTSPMDFEGWKWLVSGRVLVGLYWLVHIILAKLRSLAKGLNFRRLDLKPYLFTQNVKGPKETSICFLCYNNPYIGG